MLSSLVTATLLNITSLPPRTETNTPIFVQSTAPIISTQGIRVPRDYRVKSNGCTYRRTQAPGYPEQWILVINPQRFGLPGKRRGCPGRM